MKLKGDKVTSKIASSGIVLVLIIIVLSLIATNPFPIKNPNSISPTNEGIKGKGLIPMLHCLILSILERLEPWLINKLLLVWAMSWVYKGKLGTLSTVVEFGEIFKL